MRIIGKVTEAPFDGKEYARKNGGWTEVIGGGGGPSYIDGRVSVFADLPTASLNDDKVYIVEKPSGVPFVNRKKAGLYYSNGTSWEFMPSSVQADFVLYNNTASGLTGTDIQTAIDTLASQDKRGEGPEYLHLNSANVLKLNSIESGANLYVHPEFHPATIITQTSDYRFVSDAEKTTWNGKWNYDESVIKAVKVDNSINSDTVNNLSVLTSVPLNAVFTDTTYTASDFDIKDLLDSLGLKNVWDNKVGEAPVDGKTYGRKNGGWAEVTGGGGGAIDVSYDNTTSEITSNNVQGAIDELADLVNGIETLLAEI